jgi:putative FmdB family regulatory protein
LPALPAVHALAGRGVGMSLPVGTVLVTHYDSRVPMYEFRCGACGERFEALVDAGTESAECRLCGSPNTGRVYSAQAAPMSLVKPPGERRKQERANEKLRAGTKARFKESRRRARERRG